MKGSFFVGKLLRGYEFSGESLARRPRLGKNTADFSKQVEEAVAKSKVLSPRLEDKLTLATEEGTKLVCSALFFLAFYKDRHKNRHGKKRRLFT